MGDVLHWGYPPLSAAPTSPPQGGRVASGHLPTSPLRGEVDAKRRVGVTHTTSSMQQTGADGSHITPPRSCAPTLPLKGRVRPRRIPTPLSPLVGEMPGRAEGGVSGTTLKDGGLHG
jgi:hypothetical protein